MWAAFCTNSTWCLTCTDSGVEDSGRLGRREVCFAGSTPDSAPSAAVSTTVQTGLVREPMTRPKTAAQASIDGVPELVALGTRIRQLRTDRRLSQEDLAASAGINRVTLSKIERGVEDVGVVRLHKIAAVLEVGVENLFV